MSKQVELIFSFKAANQQVVDQLKNSMKGVTVSVRETDDALTRLRRTNEAASQSFTGAILKADLMAKAITGVGRAIKDYVKDAATYAARTDQLFAISDALARINGLSVTGVRNQATQAQRLGITTQSSLETVVRMMQARLNVGQAPQLARIAQDAAKIGGVNSSDALETIVTSIATGQVRPLHNLGLMVSYGGAYRQYAAANGIGNVNNLTQQQQSQARLQAVMQAGVGINGAYEASLTTAGGQMQSMARYTDQLKNAFGEGLQPALLDILGLMRNLTSAATSNIDRFQNLTAGIAAFGVALSTTAALGAIGVPLPAAGAVGAVAGAAAYVELHQDPAKVATESTRQALSEFDTKMRVVANEHAAGHYSDDAYKALIANAPKARENITEGLVIKLATIQKQRRDRIAAMSPADRQKAVDAVTDPDRDLLDHWLFGQSLSDDYTFAKLPDTSGLGISPDRIKHALDADPNGNLQPGKLPDDDAIQGVMQAANERGKALRAQLNAAKIAMLTGPARIAAQTAFSRSELAQSFAGIDPDVLKKTPEVGQLYGYVNQIGALDLQKYNRDQAISQAGYGSEYSFASRPLDEDAGKYRAPGDLTDAMAALKSAQQIAAAKFAAGGNSDTDSLVGSYRSAALAFATSKRSADEASAKFGIDQQVAGVRSDSSLALRRLGVSRNTDSARSSIDSEYQIRVEAAQKEFAITGNTVELRKQSAEAFADKIISTLEMEKAHTERIRQDRIEMVRGEGQFHGQMLGVTGIPGDNFTAIRERYRIQLQTAVDVFNIQKESGDLEKAQADLRQSSLSAEHEMVLAIAELRRQSLAEYENGVGRLFDAATSKNPADAMRNLAIQGAKAVGKHVAVGLADLAYGTFQKGSDGLGGLIKGQYATNPDGSPKLDAHGNPTLTGLGRVLSGTPLGINQAKLASMGTHPETALLSNTKSTDLNTEAIDRLTARISGLLGGGGGAFGTTIHSMPGFSPMFSGGAGIPSFSSSISYGGAADDSSFPFSNPLGGLPTDSSPAAYAGADNTGSGDYPQGDITGSSTDTSPMASGGGDYPAENSDALPVSSVSPSAAATAKSSNLSRGVGIAGAAIAGGFTAYDQFRHGDVRGDIGGVGALAGMAGSIMMLAGATGPAAPILAGVGLGLGVISSLMGDPKKNFENNQQIALAANRYFGPQQLSVDSDSNGNMVGADFRGNLRSSPYDAYGFQVSPSHYDTDTKAGQYNVVPGQVTDTYRPNFTLNASFIDPAGLAAHASNIADAVGGAVLKGHPLGQIMAQQST